MILIGAAVTNWNGVKERARTHNRRVGIYRRGKANGTAKGWGKRQNGHRNWKGDGIHSWVAFHWFPRTCINLFAFSDKSWFMDFSGWTKKKKKKSTKRCVLSFPIECRLNLCLFSPIIYIVRNFDAPKSSTRLNNTLAHKDQLTECSAAYISHIYLRIQYYIWLFFSVRLMGVN